MCVCVCVVFQTAVLCAWSTGLHPTAKGSIAGQDWRCSQDTGGTHYYCLLIRRSQIISIGGLKGQTLVGVFLDDSFLSIIEFVINAASIIYFCKMYIHLFAL